MTNKRHASRFAKVTETPLRLQICAGYSYGWSNSLAGCWQWVRYTGIHIQTDTQLESEEWKYG